jgi:glycosyltransferase involved in cell wall biosynthesis
MREDKSSHYRDLGDGDSQMVRKSRKKESVTSDLGRSFMKLSVIIPCFNGAATINSQLEALSNQSWSEPWELIVADNGSTDESRIIVERYKARLPHLRIVDASARKGTPYALNAGARVAKGDALAIVDADDEVAPGWVAAIGNALQRHDFVASRFDVHKLNWGWVRESRGEPQRDGVSEYDPPYLLFAGSSGMGVKRALHEAVGGFEETMPYVFDTDYCFKIQLKGTALKFVPDAIVHIRHRQTLKGAFYQARNWAEYNVLLYKRYRPLGMPALSWKANVKPWIRMMFLLRNVGNKAGRARFVRQLGWRIGRVQGSIKHRVLAL